MSDSADNDVGYGRPPKHTQFTKGKSGNPKGRPKGSRNFMTLLHEELDVKIQITENGKRRKITKREAMVKQLANKGAAGDLKAFPLLLNEIRLSEGILDAAQSGPTRDEDQKVMESIMKRMRETGTATGENDASRTATSVPTETAIKPKDSQ